MEAQIVETLKSQTKHSVPFKDSPSMQVAEEQLIKNASSSPQNTNLRVNELLKIAWKGLQDPFLTAEVLADIWLEARPSATSQMTVSGLSRETIAMFRLAEQQGASLASVVGLLEPKEFYDLMVKSGLGFYDKGAAKAVMSVGGKEFFHGAGTHLIQDLVITRAFAKAGQKLTAFQFRELLNNVQGKAPAPEIVQGKLETVEIDLGDYIWRSLYDPVDLLGRPINQPEVLFTTLKDVVPDLQ